jgi:hypothetical protein
MMVSSSILTLAIIMSRIRFLIIFLYALFTGADTYAQYVPFFRIPEGEPKRTFYGGVAAGANFSQVDGDTYSGYHKVGLHIGPLVYIRLNQMFSVSTELLYVQKGAKARSFRENSYGVPYQDQYDIKLNYVELPVMAHLYIHGRFHYGLGVSYARLLNAKEEAYTVYPINIYPDVNYFKKDDISGIGEVAYEIYKGLFVDVRFNYSLRTIRDPFRIPQGYGNGTAGRQLNNVWTVRFVCLIK